MLIDNKISLDQYFEKTKFGYIFLDDKFRYLKLNKLKILKELNISVSTYRTNKQRENVKNRDLLKTLLKYFGYDDIIFENKEKYEDYIELIVYNILYKNNINVEKELVTLKHYIKQSSYLKPIFVLLRILLKMHNSKGSKKVINLSVKADFEYIKCFKDYFTEKLEAIYYLVSLFVLEKVTPESKQNFYFQEGQIFNGLYNFNISTIYFLKNKYEKSIIYALAAGESFSKDLNFNRLVALNINLCNCYNKIEEYDKSINIGQKTLHALLYKEDYKNFLNLIQRHLVVALLHANKEKEAHKIYRKCIDINEFQCEYLVLLFILTLFLTKTTWQVDLNECKLPKNSLVNDFTAFLSTKKESLELKRFFSKPVGLEIKKILIKHKFLQK